MHEIIKKVGKMSKGIPVLDLMPGCHAERAGVMIGDRILSVNGKEVNDFNDYAIAIKDRGNSQKMVVERNGEFIDIEMVIGKPITSDSN